MIEVFIKSSKFEYLPSFSQISNKLLLFLIDNPHYMKSLKFALAVIAGLFITSCGVTLLAPSVNITAPLNGYKYLYITPTEEKTSTSGYVYNGIGGSTTHSVNPADIITGCLVKRGYTRIPELKQENLDKTFVINYGETGRRQASLFAYTIEVTLQFISADTHEVLCVSTAEGCGETEADDVRIAIGRSLDAIFK